jgi:hypothetical protein
MLSSGKYKSVLNLEAKYDIFHEILSTFNREMDFYFTTSLTQFFSVFSNRLVVCR